MGLNVRRLYRSSSMVLGLTVRNSLRRLRVRFTPAAAREAALRNARIATAADVRAQFANTRGVMTKLAQMAGYLDAEVEPDLRAALASFQRDAPTMDFALAEATILAEIPDFYRFVKEIDPIPVASASIGQVHHGRLRTGEEVAVKVQFPDAATLMGADLANAGLVTGALKLLFPSMATGEMADELVLRLAEELDYTKEARRTQTFADYYQDHPLIVVPRVYFTLSSPHVLVTQFLHGRRFEEVLDESQHARDAYGEVLFRFVFRSLYRLSLFNGDPHPGNYLFFDDGRIGFLDFGFTKEFTQTEIHLFESMIQAMVLDRDKPRFAKIVYAAGLVTRDDLDPDAIADFFRDFYDIVVEDREFTVTSAYASALLRHTFDHSHPVAKYLNVPRAFVVLQRINLGLYALLGYLQATANWRAIASEIWPFVAAPPSTPIGEAEERWLRRHPGQR
ncbi:AarF/ABC1/UbiB kinase family protein [Ferrimicrobium sp.]|uniref:ABC1 kinase family protein n=1 Tax=Ferrimicrobium sp. TaxID=2926050 RepID=UPI00260EE136|nr:AarF/ABC1/UbiB kinase family protein [Ferrimicrobium sp.]